MVKNMVVVQTGCECEQGGGETCLLEMWENGHVSENGCVDSLIGRIELLS